MAHMFWARSLVSPGDMAFSYPVNGSWQESTWGETRELVESLAAGLIGLGIEAEDRVAIISETRFEWILADLAIMCAGGATTTVYPSTRADEVAHILNDSDASVVLVDSLEQVAKLRAIRGRILKVRKVVLFDGDFPDGRVMTLEGLLRAGDEVLERDPACVSRRMGTLRSDMLASLMYTSGTTGTPKGVRHTHSAWTYEGTAIAAQGVLGPDDLQYLWLPLSHSFGKVLLSTQMACGFPTAVDGDVDRIIDNLAVVQPTFMGAAPRIFEKVHSRIVAMQDQEGGIRRRVFEQAFAVARRRRAYLDQGKRVPYLLGKRYDVLDKAVFAKIRERFGPRLRFFISGAAALNPDIAEFFGLAGIEILEGYGLTESAAGSFVNRPEDNTLGTVGHVFPGTEVRLAADGEVLLRGPGVMTGYHNMPAETASVLRNGWLSTGDIGTLDHEGRLRITDRKKDFFKTAGGKYVAPTYLEGRLKAACPYVADAVVIGNDRPYCVAVLTLDETAIVGWAQHAKLRSTAYADVLRDPATIAMVDGHVTKLNATLNRWETIKQFVVADRELSVECGEMTPSMKVKRSAIEAGFADEIAAMYPVEESARHGDFEVSEADLAAEVTG
ncbi:long-chain fatty acid--CoA ligase [Nocardioides currus]|uniref:Acyl-CoA synthetase n=2 Tax=Nocardioides currus TaxID=2133958 RepID=A0A2R7YXP0_9ACTN|nr:long-chain fatty acid--CoA ligase [Nocardioides currus]